MAIDILGYCKRNCEEVSDSSDDIEKVISWLKFFKERVRPQLRQEWSKEDELNFNQAIYVCHQYRYYGVETWLKSFKDKYNWKPSDEQIRPLGYAIDYFKKKKNDTTYLESLYKDLKKLREE